MSNKLGTIEAIDGRACEAAFEKSGRDPKHLSKFLKKYPAGFYLSWVKKEIAGWYGSNDYENLRSLQPGRGERKTDTGIQKVFTDFLIYKSVLKLQEEKPGLSLTSEKGIFQTLTNRSFIGTTFSYEQIRDRYYRFLKYEPAIFIDNDKKMIFGPGRVSLAGFDMVGFLEWAPNKGFHKK